jgi:hypothetical protein
MNALVPVEQKQQPSRAAERQNGHRRRRVPKRGTKLEAIEENAFSD